MCSWFSPRQACASATLPSSPWEAAVQPRQRRRTPTAVLWPTTTRGRKRAAARERWRTAGLMLTQRRSGAALVFAHAGSGSVLDDQTEAGCHVHDQSISGDDEG